MSHVESGGTRYTWTLTEQVPGADGKMVKCSGADSESVLSTVFTMYLKNRGDVSNWTDRHRFGMMIEEHSDLDPDAIAVWLSFSDRGEMYDDDQAFGRWYIPTTEPPFEFEGLDGDPIVLERTTE